jgi:penicillin-binding protein 2
LPHFSDRALRRLSRVLSVILAVVALCGASDAQAAVRKKPTAARAKAPTPSQILKTAVQAGPKSPKLTASRKPAPTRTRTVRTRRRRAAQNNWLVPTYVEGNGLGDNTEGDDLAVRAAALEALGRRNGTVVVADPQTGRVLTVVNQNLAFGQGFQPCSTIKLVVGLGALAEGIVNRDTPVKISRRASLTLTEALAKSNNMYFANLGQQMGFDKVRSYAHLFGLGERATSNVDREQPGSLTDASPANGGVGMMSSFGEGIQLTPMQLAAIMSAIANGGTLYHMQYPQTQFEAQTFEPHIKRQLTIGPWISEMKPGMMGAVEFGTARRAAYSVDEPILGKTGTCTDRATPTHLGWFGSFNDVSSHKLVVVVLLTGGAHVSGPEASAIGGDVYRRLSENRYFSPAQVAGAMTLATIGGE